MKIKEIIVVEGRDDTKKVQLAVNADTIETNGSAIDEEILKQIEKAQKIRGVIVLTDPDFPGGKIREIIIQRIPGVKHAFIRKEDCQSPKGGSLGIEHASEEVIRSALEKVQTPYFETDQNDLSVFFMELGLLGKPKSSEYRKQLGDYLGIGHTNGKQFVKRIRMFQITQEEILAAMEQNGIPIPPAVQKEMK
ncbi:MAG TPA: ribonuclease M5 [Candidatus Jeotgalibaca pullicola]|nr:ribonuclease M5 [Candidatus Jeotgalibaca pullicola]